MIKEMRNNTTKDIRQNVREYLPVILEDVTYGDLVSYSIEERDTWGSETEKFVFKRANRLIKLEIETKVKDK